MEAFTSTGDTLYDDVRRRCNNTIMFYDGVPVVLRHVERTYLAYWPIETYQQRTTNSGVGLIEYTDTKLVDMMPTLGYVNSLNGRAAFISRGTVRSQRAGLPIDQLIADGSYVSYDIVYSEAFKNMLLNNYPSMQDAYNQTNTRVRIRAFSKSYAIDLSLNIYHRGTIIGRLKPSERYYAGYEIGYHAGITRVSFYRKNFEDRFSKQLAVFKEDKDG